MQTVTTPLRFRDVEMIVEAEYDEGEPAIYWPTDAAHPGSPEDAILIRCLVGGVDVMPLLDDQAIRQIEREICWAMV